MLRRSLCAAAIGLMTLGCEPVDPSGVPSPTSPVDLDGDGYGAADCDDQDPDIHPGATEVCDPADKDEDCDGLSDNADTSAAASTRTRYYHDVDTDGFGDPDSQRETCDDPSTAGDWWTRDSSDCDDRRAEVHPGATEVCNQRDDDCDEAVDESLICDDLPTPTPTPAGSTVAPTPPPTPEATEPPQERTPIQPRTPRPTPTVAPTPTQQPPPRHQWQGFTRFAVAEEERGLDYDGDGLSDNGVYYALEVIQTELIAVVFAEIEAQTDIEDQDDPCETTEEGCAFTPVTALAAKAAAVTFIQELVSVETINQALVSAFDAAVTPWAIELETEGAVTHLHYYAGSVQQVEGSYGFQAERHIGLQSGAMRTDGTPTLFGPGTFDISVSVEDEEGGEPTTVGFQIKEALTRFVFDPRTISGALTGGGMQIIQLVGVVQQVLDGLEEAQILPEDFDKEATLADVEDALRSACDIVCPSTGEPCFSVTFTYDTEFLTTVFPLN